MKDFFADEFQFDKGLSREDYFSLVSGKSLHQRRYEADPDPETLDFFSDLKRKRKVIFLTEPHCPDCAWVIPFVARLISESSVLEAKYFLKSIHEKLMDNLLSNGKRSIPKIAILDGETNKLLRFWGPRPSPIQKYVEQSVGKIEVSVWKTKVYEYYRSNGLKDLYRELKELFSE